MISPEKFRQLLVEWFRREGKSYPWRETRDPWAILVSEIMLQQTTIATIQNRYPQWMAQFPTVQSLAQAEEQTALRSWEGLGYYQRIRNLQKAARVITLEKNGQFPTTAEELRKLPGIGIYTAAAVASFAYHQPEPLVDANVARVFSRLFDDDTPVDSPKGIQQLAQRAELLLDRDYPHLYNSALMELGQIYCKKSPECLLCPVRTCCTTTRPASLPVKLPKQEIVLVYEHALLCLNNDKTAILLQQSTEGSRRHGFWKLPLRLAEECLELPRIHTHKYGITHHRVTQDIYLSPAPATLRTEEAWIPLARLGEHPLASPDRKALHHTKLKDYLSPPGNR